MLRAVVYLLTRVDWPFYCRNTNALGSEIGGCFQLGAALESRSHGFA